LLVRRLILAAVFFISSGTACAGGKPTSTARPDRNLITKEQIETNHFHTAYEAVQALHANWLRARTGESPNSPTIVKVIVDESEVGGTDALKDISTQTVSAIRFYDGPAAQSRWGVDHTAGVIHVSTLIRPPVKRDSTS
jgi:hypothetical protein